MSYKTIDCHLHTWILERCHYEWITFDAIKGTPLDQSWRLEQVEPCFKDAGVDGAILVNCENHFEDFDYMLELAGDKDYIVGVVGWAPLLEPDQTAAAIYRYKKNPYFKGVRHLIHEERDSEWLLRENVLESLQLVAQNGLSYDVVGVTPRHLKAAIRMAEKVPGLRIVLDHLNQPPIETTELGEWGDLMRVVAENPTAYAKVSGLGTASNNWQGWQAKDLAPYIEHTLNVFGTDRVLCGGDWPLAELAGGYVKAWKAYRKVLEGLLNEEDQAKVFQHNAEKFYQVEV